MASAKHKKLLPLKFFMTDERRHAELISILQNFAPGTGVIFRHYTVPDRAGLAQKIAEVCRQKKLPLLIAGDISLAKEVGADGVHFPRWAFPGDKVLPALNPNWIFIASAHNLRAIKRAEKFGADGLLLAPVFPTKSHPDRVTLGVSGFVKLATATDLPVYALGGLSHENLKELPALKNFAGYAGISIFEK